VAELNWLSVQEAHSLLTSRQISSVELTQACLDRIDAIEDVEFSHIWHQLRRKKIKGGILTFVSDCRDVRNKLSHGVLIENAKLRKLIDGWKAIQEVLPKDKILAP